MAQKSSFLFIALYLAASACLLLLHLTKNNHFEEQWQRLPAQLKQQYSEQQIAVIKRQFEDLQEILKLVADSHFGFPNHDDLLGQISLKQIMPKQASEIDLLDATSETHPNLLIRHANSILSTLDPYTKFQTEQDKALFKNAKKGTYGIVVENNTVLIKVNSITPETPQKILTFFNKSADELGKRLNHIVLDLRGNTGGNLEAAYTIVDLFSNEETLGSFQRRNPSASKPQIRMIESFHAPITNLPISVLVDHQTASSAELIAGALQQLVDATVIGQTTNGKASGQIQKQINNASFSDETLFITIGKIFLPDGTSYHQRGIVPDISVFDEKMSADIAFHDQQQVVAADNTTKEMSLIDLTCKTEYSVEREIDIYDPVRRRSARAPVVNIGGRDLACALQARAH